MTKPVAVNQAMQQMGLKFHNIIIQRLIPLIIRRDYQMRLPFRQKMIAPTSTTKKPSPILFKELSPLLFRFVGPGPIQKILGFFAGLPEQIQLAPQAGIPRI
jgi:hypothetical protein